MKIKLTKEQFTHSIVNARIIKYNEQIKKFIKSSDNLNRAFLTEIDSQTVSIFKSSPLFHTSTAHCKRYHYKRYYYRIERMMPLLDVANALYNGIISEFELSDGADIRAYLELFGEKE